MLTQCPRLKVLDEEEVTEHERLRMLLDPISEPAAGDSEDFGHAAASEGQRFPRFQYFGLPKLSPLPVHADMLAATFSLPSRMVINVLQRIQDSLTNLLVAPPQARFLFEPDGGFEQMVAEELHNKSGGAGVERHAAPEIADKHPTGGNPAALDALDEEHDNGPQGKYREERKRARLENEARLKRGTDLLRQSQVQAEEEAFER